MPTLHSLPGCLLLLGLTASAQSLDDSRRIKPTAPSKSGPPSRKALLIGNRNYRNSPLQTPVNDANDLGKVLQQLGFATQVLTDSSKANIETAIHNFTVSLGAGDIGVFFYSGHGIQIDSENYLVPVEFSAADEAQAKNRAVPFSNAKSGLEQSPAKLVLMILDSCRDNPFASAKAAPHGLALLEAGLGSYIAFAASPGKIAKDNSSERNGLFTKYLLQELKQPVPVSELFRKVRQDVFQASAGNQLPYLHDQVIADFTLQSSGPVFTGADQAKQSTPVSGEAIEIFEDGKRLYHEGHCEGAMKRFDRLIRKEPENAFAQNALGLAYACLKMNTPAAEHFSMAIELKPNYAAAYLNRGQIYLNVAQYSLAIQDFSWAIDEEPENAIFYSWRGQALFGLRRYEDAQTDFSQAIQLNPFDPHGLHGRGQVLHQFGKLREALVDYDAAISLKQNFAAAYSDRAKTRERLGDQTGAAADRAAVQRYSGRN